MAEHYFKFKTHLGPGKRPCGECGLPYDEAEHIEINLLQPYKHYVCPNAGGEGHLSRYTGAYPHEMRKLTDDVCICGTKLIEEDTERWRVSWEMQAPVGTPWRPVDAVSSKHAAKQQYDGLLELISQGELIRKVRLAVAS